LTERRAAVVSVDEAPLCIGCRAFRGLGSTNATGDHVSSTDAELDWRYSDGCSANDGTRLVSYVADSHEGGERPD
jgi:hypothetical protein